MIKVILIGASGRMGRAIKDCIAQSDEFELIGELDSKLWQRQDKLNGNVIIDFSLPEALDQVIGLTEKTGLPLVTGVTGYSDKQLENLKRLSEKVPVYHSQNMSMGVAWLRRIFSQVPSEWKISTHLVDLHHKDKKDAPSGTAKTFAADLGIGTNQISSIRSGAAVGTHSVIISLHDEEIIIEHRAFSRNLFAKGALQAARWVQNKKPGFYSTLDMIS